MTCRVPSCTIVINYSKLLRPRDRNQLGNLRISCISHLDEAQGSNGRKQAPEFVEVGMVLTQVDLLDTDPLEPLQFWTKADGNQRDPRVIGVWDTDVIELQDSRAKDG